MTETAVRPQTEQTTTAPAAWRDTAHRYADETRAEASWLQALAADDTRDPAVSA
jgi:hypothetical protein